MAKRNYDLQTIRTEGGILPADQLSRIATGDAEAISPQDYDLAPGEKVNEAISQSWARLTRFWADFQESRQALPKDQPGTEVTNQKWLLPLFRELGYGKLTTSKAPEIDGKPYPITRFHAKLPIHLVGCNILLDKRSPGVKGAATGTPHGLVQEFLNRSPDSLWAFVSNGLQLRVLRDNVALSRQAYVEFDLEAMFDGEVYSDFALLWMVCHVTRTEGDRPEQCWLEKWSASAREHGTRILNDLRTGVQRAIEALGRGFISHPVNDVLRQQLRDGTLAKQDLYHQVLRTVYRLLFLFVAEDRGLLHPPGASETAQGVYDTHYSTRRLRDLAGQIKGSRHGDLWHVLSLVFRAVSGDPQAQAIRDALALPVLGSRLWNLSETAAIAGPGAARPEPVEGDTEIPAYISNDDLLDAIRHLAYVQQNNTLRTVNYRDLGSEELGSVYESLLELQPDIHPEARQFELRTVAGSERKTTGSYYTPDSLVQCLLDSALEPVIADRLKAAATIEDKQQALLDLKVCDPASGSGHFLIAAAHRIARHLSRLRAMAAGEAEPTPEVYQHALRDVISHCIYGVDINPMAVELCKVSLWLEAIDPGKPLAFLDHHIQCGNSLLGTTPALLKKGIPDDAFKLIEGDDPAVCKQLKAENKTERQGQRRLWGAMPSIHLGNMAQTLANINAEDDSTPQALVQKEKHYRELITSSAYENARFLADAWCAAFVWPKTDPVAPAVTTETIRRIEDNPNEFPAGSPIREGVRKLAGQYHFFHWHLVFPDVFRVPAQNGMPENEQTGCSGGFDCVLGNPPWERVKLQEKEWFAGRLPDIANAINAAARKRLIRTLRTEDPALAAQFAHAVRAADAESGFLRRSGAFPLCGVGDVNTFAVFTELATFSIRPDGMVGLVIPTGLATDDQLKEFFASLIRDERLHSLVGFENEEFLFAGIANVVRYCAISIAGKLRRCQAPRFAFYIRNAHQIHDMERYFSLTKDELRWLNPNTETCPIFRTRFDAQLTLRLYQRFPILRNARTATNPWGLTYLRMFDMANDSNLFLRERTPESLPLYEAKLFWHYDHRFGSYALKGHFKGKGGRGLPDMPLQYHQNQDFAITPQYWVDRTHVMERIPRFWHRQWLVAYRDVSSAKLERTLVASILPFAAANHTAPVMLMGGGEARVACRFLGAFNSLVVDYIARQKIGGTHVSFFHVDQLPFPLPDAFTAWDDSFICPRVLELTYTAQDVREFAEEVGWGDSPFRWEPERRFAIQCELDAFFAHMYGLSREEWLFVLDPEDVHGEPYVGESFRVLKEKENGRFGEYRTKLLCMHAYDELARAKASDWKYKSNIDPPPGPPIDAAGNFIPYAGWTDEIRERYKNVIHPPRPQAVPQAVLDKGQAILEILCLLHIGEARLDTTALTLGLVLMRHDSLRQEIAANGIGSPSSTAPASRPRVQNLANLLREYAAEGVDILTLDGSVDMTMVALGKKAYSVEEINRQQVGAEALVKAREAMVAIKKIQETCKTNEACLDAMGVENEAEITIQ